MTSSQTLQLSLCCGLVFSNLNAVDLSLGELQAFTTQKYRLNYEMQKDEDKTKIQNEYLQILKIANAIPYSFKDDPDFLVASNLVKVDIWAQKFMKNAQVSDKQLQDLYQKIKPKVHSTYLLRNILVKNEHEADQILKTLSSIANQTSRTEKLKKLVETSSHDFVSRKNQGLIGWVDQNKLDLAIQNALKGKKQFDIVKVNVGDLGWHIIAIEDYKPEHEASFDEAKEILIQIAKQELLKQEIQKIEALNNSAQ